jgi:cell filamentation protein
VAYITDSDDRYIDPQTNILHNLFNISDQTELDQLEAEITYVEIGAILIDSDVKSYTYDFNLLCDIHKRLFSAIYEWAGETRTLDMEKGTTYFAHVPYILSESTRLFDELKRENGLQGLSKDDFIKRVAHYYGELNVIHPFREGNGRTIRVFFSLLAYRAGWNIDWSRMDSQENIDACAASYSVDDDLLCKMFEKLVEPQI